MEPIKQTWKTVRSREIFSWYIPSVSRPQAVILLVHDFGEYSWRYKQWAKKFAYNGFVFVSWDHYGHGISDGEPGNIKNYEQFLLEIDLAITKVSEQFPSLPIVLYGQGMGGNIALNYAIRRTSPISLLVITSPWLSIIVQLSKVKRIMLNLFSVFLPSITLKMPIKAEQLSHSEDAILKYNSDKLVHNTITPHLISIMSKASRYAIKNASKIRIPTLLMHGSADSLTSCNATNAIANTIRNATFVEWPDLYHELHNETKQNEVFMNIQEWLTHYLSL